MPRFFLSLSLIAAAFALAWWAGSLTLKSGPSPNSGREGVEVVGVVRPDGRGKGQESALARRSAELLAEENPDIAGIQRIFSTGHADAEEVRRLARQWAETDPEGLWRWLRIAQPAGDRTLPMVEELFAVWFRKNPQAAIAAYRSAAGLEVYSARNGLLKMMFGEGTSPDLSLMPYVDEIAVINERMWLPPGAPEGAALISLFTGLPEGKGRDALLRTAASGWLSQDWKGASAWAAELTEPLRSKMMDALLRTAFDVPGYSHGSGLPDEARQWATQWFGGGASPEMRLSLGPSYVGALAKTDPAVALTWAGENLDARVLSRAVEQVLKSQAFQDPAAARAIVESLPPGGVRQRAVFEAVSSTKVDAESVAWLMANADKSALQWGTVAYNWAAGKPEELRSYLESADAETLPEFMLQGASRGLLEKDGPGTMDWALSLPSPVIAGTALKWWAFGDPASAAGWLEDHTATGWSPESLAAVSKGYFDRDPESAVDWAASLPAGSTRDTAIKEIQGAMEQNTVLPETDRSRLAERLGK